MTRLDDRSHSAWKGAVLWLLVWFGLTAIIGAIPAGAEDSRILPVPKLTIYPGDVISDDWLDDRDFARDFARDVPAGRPAMVESRAMMVGKIARRTLLPGAPVPVNAIGERNLVAHGAKVRVVFEDGELTIVTYGTALQSGAVGVVIPVRNMDSGVTISGTVQADGSVSVSGG